MPGIIHSLVTRWPLRQAMEAIFGRSAYSASTLRRAFADPGRAPTELRELVTQRRPCQLLVVTEIFLAADPPVPPPQVRTLLVWGAEDHLLGSNVKVGRRRERSLPKAELAVIPGAGHLPQLEKPDEFCTHRLGLREWHC
jgi:2-hydroxy-6-oxonona-2,4-dienedioate hydrolase